MQSTFHNSVTDEVRRAELSKKVRVYRKKVLSLKELKAFNVHEASLYIAGDDTYQKAIQKSLTDFKDLKYVFLIGIGGSNLGTEAVYEALQHNASPKLVVLDSIEPEALQTFTSTIKQVKKLSDIAVVVVSKSGTTTETMLNAIKVVEICEQKFGDACRTRCIFVGDKDTAFWKIGKKKKILCVAMPETIGGRYSIFSAVGIVPLTLLGIDVTSLRKGALAALEDGGMDMTESAAIDLAVQAESGVHAINYFTFNDRLKKCGFWHRQLLAESIGKPVTKKKQQFTHQLLPIVSSSVDLHSMAQLFLGGYKHLYTHFVTFKDITTEKVSKTHWLGAHMPTLAGQDVLTVKSAITNGVCEAYNDQQLPYRYTELSDCSAFEIGYLLNSLMYEVMCLGLLFDVDPFNQPQVELYKQHMRAFLK